MKSGDLVTPANGISRSLSPVNFSKIGWRREDFVTVLFEVGEVGTILEIGGENYYGKRSMRILVPQGIGWCFEDGIEVVNEIG